jgi:dihydroorotate dehydrogenase electron transfer subunit
MIQEKSEILWNLPEGPQVYRIGIECGNHYASAFPGQFVTLRLPEDSTPILRRPFSIHRLISKEGAYALEILYKAIGGFTRKLSRAAAGEAVDLLGPLGKGFSVSASLQSVAIVAGGIGVAPMVFLARALLDAGMPPSGSAVFIGAAKAGEVLCRDDFRRLGLAVYTATEDGTLGEEGFVTRPLEPWIAANRPDMLFACGPMPMLRAVSEAARALSIPCEVSVETLMACGVGACLGCATRDRHHEGGYGHVCIDGPVFEASRLSL